MQKYSSEMVYNYKENRSDNKFIFQWNKSELRSRTRSNYMKGTKIGNKNCNVIIENPYTELSLKNMESPDKTSNTCEHSGEISIQTFPTEVDNSFKCKSLQVSVNKKQVLSPKNQNLPLKTRSRNLPTFIILHYSPFKAVWDWIVLLLVLYTSVFTPYTIAFLLNEDKAKVQLNKDPKTRLSLASDNQAGPLIIIDLIVDVIFIADIFINFRTTYVHSGEVISEPQKIASNYIRGWFLLDACAAIPFDLVLFGSGGSTNIMTTTGVLKTARLLRLLRVARRIHQYSEYGAMMMLFLMGTFTLVAHWLACFFYIIAYYEKETWNEKIGWLDSLALLYNKPFDENRTDSLSLGGPSIESRYITSLYFVVTAVTSIGFGNVAPNTNAEKVFCIVAMLIGSMMSAAIFGNVSSIVLRLYQGSEECHEKRTSIKEFIKFHRIPKHLAKRLIDSVQSNGDYTGGINMNVILRAFPECLQADICLHMNRTLVNTCPAFRGASAGCLRAFALKFKTTHVPPGDSFIHPGDLLDSVYFISRGSVEIAYIHEGPILERVIMKQLNKHEIFGGCPTDFLDNKMSQSQYSVYALGSVDLNRISLIDLREILLMYPEWSASFLTSFKITFKLNELHSKLKNKSKIPSVVQGDSCIINSQIPENICSNANLTIPKDIIRKSSCGYNLNFTEAKTNLEYDFRLVTKRMQKLNSRAQEMERNYQTAFTEILQLLTSS